MRYRTKHSILSTQYDIIETNLNIYCINVNTAIFTEIDDLYLHPIELPTHTTLLLNRRNM